MEAHCSPYCWLRATDRGSQVSEEDKAKVPPEAQEAARRMAREGLAKALRDIDMGEGEWATYQSYLGRIAPQVSQLRVVLESAEDRSEERSWVKHQTSGELDDTKLVDGMTGDRTMYAPLRTPWLPTGKDSPDIPGACSGGGRAGLFGFGQLQAPRSGRLGPPGR